MKSLRLLSILIVLAFSILPFLVFAQTADTLSPDVSIILIPNNPAPLQSTQATVSSYSIDANQVQVVWKYNDRTISSGTGNTHITFTAPAAGQTGTLSATVSGASFPTTTATYILRGASVDMLWEAADAYVPPFYKGKALPATNAVIQVTAVPSKSAPKNASFQWSRNGSAVEQASGYNKTSYAFKNDTLQNTEQISVGVQGGAFTGNGSITVTPRAPSIVLYQKKDGFVDYANGSLSTALIAGSGAVLHFEPYYFSTNGNLGTSLTFDMKTNDTAVYSEGAPNELPISRPSDGAQGVLDVAVTTTTYSLQNLERKFTLSFK